ncbi:hypothetical protein ACLOJK_009872 [Asimina triloba]
MLPIDLSLSDLVASLPPDLEDGEWAAHLVVCHGCLSVYVLLSNLKKEAVDLCFMLLCYRRWVSDLADLDIRRCCWTRKIKDKCCHWWVVDADIATHLLEDLGLLCSSFCDARFNILARS